VSFESLCGPLVVGGFSGTSLPLLYQRALATGRRGGAILFSSNATGGPLQVAALAREVHRALGAPLLAIDQEGGRVARIRAPALIVPPMRTIGQWNDAALAERIARAVGAQLSVLGVTINFAPVLDVDTRSDNPVIGDRAFGRDPAVCARMGAAWIAGLQGAGVLATGKHFPGHGDTALDSHVDLPVVDQDLDRIESVELMPFRAAVTAGVAALMTAHVVFPKLDACLPGTLSRSVCTELRERIGFRGLLVSDDLEMSAIAAQAPAGDAAVLAVAAGCDVVLLCHSFDAQEEAVDALVFEAERSPAFRARCEQASARGCDARARATARPQDDDAIERVFMSQESSDLAEEIASRLAES